MSLETVLITGANRGIGLEFVRQLLASKTPPKYLIATSRGSSNEELDKLKAKHSSLHVLTLDTKNFNEFEEFAKNVKQIVGDLGVDTLINNAGIHIKHDLNEVIASDMIENFEVNVVGPLILIKTLLPLLKKAGTQRKTAIINISSLLGSIETITEEFLRFRSSYPYRTSKSALNMVTKCLSIDLKADQIVVIALHPGWVQTDLGGPNAPLTVPDSISYMLKTIQSIDESKSGKLVSYDGTILPY